MQALFEFLRTFWRSLLPFVVVRDYERAVRFTMGKSEPQLDPGFHWLIPGVQQYEILGVAEDVMDLPEQSITTTDGVSVTLSANIIYRIVDAQLAHIAVQDFEQSLTRAAMNHIARKTREWTYQELSEGQKDLERSLKNTMTTRVEKWGVEIVDVGITDLVKAENFRHFGQPMWR
jgi:regulator of protease activity HflC (stomatin/prohibitin superfamily)